MFDFSRSLGDAVKRARGRLGLTQAQVADAIDADVRTVMNIENYKGNPKLEILYPLVRCLHIDPREIFTPEMQRGNPALFQLRMLIDTCSDQEAEDLVKVVQTVLSVMRRSDVVTIK